MAAMQLLMQPVGERKLIYYLALKEHDSDKLWIRMLFGDPIMRKEFSTIAFFCPGDIAVLCLLEGILCFA